MTKPVPNAATLTVHPANPKSSSMNDLLSLDTPSQHTVNDVKHSASSDDLLNFGAVSFIVYFLQNLVSHELKIREWLDYSILVFEI